MKKKICHITTVHQPFDVRIFHKECISLANNGFDVYLIARHDRDECINGVNIVAIANETAKGFGRLINIWNAFKKALNLKAKIFHIHDPELLPLGILIKLFTGAKIIYDAHEDPKLHSMYQIRINKNIRFLIANIIGFIEWICEKFYDRVIVVLDTHAQRFNSKTVILHNYPKLEEYDFKNSGSPPPNSLIYVGGVRQERAIIEILKALVKIKKEIPDIQFDLIGPFIPESFEQILRSTIDEYKLNENVVVYGKIPFSEVSKYVKNAEIGLSLVHNYNNALPTKIFEYMMMKKPVVVSNAPITEKIVNYYECGVAVNPLDPNEIAREIINLLTDHTTHKKMGNNGYEAVLKIFNWKEEEKKLIECYNKLK